MAEDENRVIPVVKGRVDCLPGKKEPVEHCGLCIYSREFRVNEKQAKSPALAYCAKCRVTEKVDYSKATAVTCADRQREGFHSITNLIG